jgi:hypothetical protein
MVGIHHRNIKRPVRPKGRRIVLPGLAGAASAAHSHSPASKDISSAQALQCAPFIISEFIKLVTCVRK